MSFEVTRKIAKMGTPQMFLVAISRKHHPAVIMRSLQTATWQAAVKQALDDAHAADPTVDVVSLSSDPATHNDEWGTIQEMATTIYLLNGTGLSVCVVRPVIMDINTGYALEHEVSPVSNTRIRVIAEVIELDRETIYQM